jgi:outer membrane receptor protein involved in Fe transport
MARFTGKVVTAICFFGAASAAFAQFTSNVQGVVQDQTSAAIPNATVRLRSLSTDVARTTKTSDAGVYRFSSLQPGGYDISVEAAGFQTKTVTVTLQTAQTADLNIGMSVAASNQAVEVRGNAILLDTADSRIQATIRQETLQDLPFQGRNFMGLVAVAPGVTGVGAVGGGAPSDAPDNFGTEKTVNASGNGRNYAGNEFVMDGLNVTSNIIQGVSNLSPNPDSIQEVSIQTNTFSVEQGKASSIVVNITSKSGTNQFHGTGSYFFNNQDLRARTEFTTKYGPYKRHDLAGTLGGPIIKNKTFFFASVEPLWSQVSLATNVRTFEAPEFVDWAKQNYPGTLGTRLLLERPLINQVQTGVNKRARDLFTDCGTPARGNIPCDLPVIAEGRFNAAAFRNALQYNFRGDQYFRDGRDRLYGNYYKTDLDTEQVPGRVGYYSINNNNTKAFQTSWTHTFTPSLLNEGSFGFIRVEGSFGGYPGLPFHIPTINIDQVSQNFAVPSNGPGAFIQHNYNWRDVVSWVRGSHSLKFGFEAWSGDDDAQFANNSYRPTFRFLNLLDFVQDNPYSETGAVFDPLTGKITNGAYRHLMNTAGAFVQDEWKVKSNLTLTLGIRWDDYGNPHPDTSKTLTFGNILLGPGKTIDEQIANASVRQVPALYEGRLNKNFSPRAGFAWDPSKQGAWSIRGGIGLYHDWIPLGEANRIRNNPPGNVVPTFLSGSATPPLFVLGSSDAPPFGFTFPQFSVRSLDEHGGILGQQVNTGGIDRNIHPSNTLNYVIGVERRLFTRTVAGANYSGSYTWDGIIGTDLNRYAGDLLDGTLNRLNPSFGTMFYEFNANEIHYNALILTLRHEFGRGSMQSSYTFGKVTDFGSAGERVNRDPGNAFPEQHDLQRYQAPADWDVRHRFSFSGNYRIPNVFANQRLLKAVVGGWEWSAVAILQTGTPFTVFNGAPFQGNFDASGKFLGFKAGSGDYNADGVNYDWPNMPMTDYTGTHTRQQYITGLFQKSEFGVPAPGTEGNMQRSAFRNPGLIQVDTAMIKNNALPFIGERGNLQLRFEFFNVLNRVNLQGVSADLNSSTFGRSTSTYDPRVIQLGARLLF